MKVIVITHIIAGIISLVSGIIAITSKKGGKLHLKSGKIYFFGMTYVFVSALILSSIKFIPFLFMIAFLSYYTCYSGVRILKYKRPKSPSLKDKSAGFITLFMGILYCLYAVTLFMKEDPTSLKWVSLVFGILTIRASIIGLNQIDVIPFIKTKKQNWLEYHLYAMGISYLAATTAFVVTMGRSLDFNHWILWLGPTIIGIPLINRWRRKLTDKKNVDGKRTHAKNEIEKIVLK